MSVQNLEKFAEVLDVAAEHMALHGRCTGSFEESDGRVCAVGAINIAVRQVLGLDASQASATGQCYDYTRAAEHSALRSGAITAVLDQLRKVKNEEGICAWNDAARRRQHDVIEVFNKAEAKLLDTAQALRDLGQAE